MNWVEEAILYARYREAIDAKDFASMDVLWKDADDDAMVVMLQVHDDIIAESSCSVVEAECVRES